MRDIFLTTRGRCCAQHLNQSIEALCLPCEIQKTHCTNKENVEPQLKYIITFNHTVVKIVGFFHRIEFHPSGLASLKEHECLWV